MPEIRKIIIDTDPGQDDAVAIMTALASPELEILGITAPLRVIKRSPQSLLDSSKAFGDLMIVFIFFRS